MVLRTIAVATKTIAKVIQNLPRERPIRDAQKSAPIKEIPAMTLIGIIGSRKKLLNVIARYSLAKTAIQKTGSEKRRNATKVSE
jgi:hypothetical protein